MDGAPLLVAGGGGGKSRAADAPSRLSLCTHLGLSAYWLPTNLTYLALSVLILPDAIAGFMPDSKGPVLGGLVAVGAFMQLVGPYFGAMSDRTNAARGRGPYMVAGTVGLCVGLLLMAVASDFGLLGAGYLVYQLCSTLAVQPYTAVVADCVAADERGTASGFVGLSQFVGSLLAGALGLVAGEAGTANLLAAIAFTNLVCCAWSVAAIAGRRRAAAAAAAAAARSAAGGAAAAARKAAAPYENWVSMVRAPFKRSARFCWLFALATFYAASAGVAGLYIQYFYIDCVVVVAAAGGGAADDDGGGANAYGSFGAFGDTLHVHTPESAAAAFLLVNLFFSALASVGGGALSDWLDAHWKAHHGAAYDDGDLIGDAPGMAAVPAGGGAERVVAAGLLITTASYALMGLVQTFVASLVAAALLGVGAGFVMAPMWALGECSCTQPQQLAHPIAPAAHSRYLHRPWCCHHKHASPPAAQPSTFCPLIQRTARATCLSTSSTRSRRSWWCQ